MDETLMGREQPVDEQGIETLKQGIEFRLFELCGLLEPHEAIGYVLSLAERMQRELNDEAGPFE